MNSFISIFQDLQSVELIHYWFRNADIIAFRKTHFCRRPTEDKLSQDWFSCGLTFADFSVFGSSTKNYLRKTYIVPQSSKINNLLRKTSSWRSDEIFRKIRHFSSKKCSLIRYIKFPIHKKKLLKSILIVFLDLRLG